MSQRKIWEKLLSAERPGAGKVPGTPERTAFQQDYDRIVFTSAFRRMKDKTQVFPLSKSDYVRTRLTHSLEASCVGRSLGAVVGREIIARHGLQYVESGDFGAIVAAACLAHDIGNPPFGHAGEDAIREWFCTSGVLDRHPFTSAQRADFERYEGNAQGFRIVTRLQNPANPGLQLTSAVLATFTKYPRPSQLDAELDGKSGKKFGFFQQDAEAFQQVARSTGLVERIPGTAWRRHPLAFLVEVADDTCYLIVDLEDAAKLGFVPYRDAECLLADLAGNTVSGRRLERLHDPKERLEYLRAKAIGCLLESAAAVFLENEDALFSRVSLTTNCSISHRSRTPCRRYRNWPRKLFTTPARRWKLKPRVLRCWGLCWVYLPMPSRPVPGMPGLRPGSACCSNCCRLSFRGMAVNRIPIPISDCCKWPISSPE
jgi:dGTPase